MVIDEISMCSQYDFEWINKRCKQAMDCQEPFGGLNVILVGDFKQLPPVRGKPLWYLEKDEHGRFPHNAGWILYRYFTPYLLKKVQRQNDTVFLDLLSRLPDGEITDDDFNLLSARSPGNNPDWEDQFKDAIRLFPTNLEVSKFNIQRLLQLQKPIVKIQATHSGKNARNDGSEWAMGLTSSVILCEGARVMLRMNLWAETGLVNGAMGTVKEIIYKNNEDVGRVPLAVMVQFDEYSGPSFDPHIDRLVPIVPQRSDYQRNGCSKSRTQIPVCLAYAVTIHKSQGQTLQRAVVDVGEKPMKGSTGLAFVAISRLKSLDGLLLVQRPKARYTAMIQKQKDIDLRKKEEIRLHEVHQRILTDQAARSV